jgi:hypothetical protein
MLPTLGIILFFEKDFFKDRYNYILLCLICVALILSKQIGILFLGILAFAYLLKIILCRKELNENKKIDRECIKLIALICIPLIFSIIWKLQINDYSINRQFNYTEIEKSQIIDIFTNNNLSENQLQFTPKFINSLFNKNITALNINISYIVAISLIFLGFIAIFIYNKIKKQKLENKKVVFSGIVLIAINITYIIVLYLTYMLFFNDDERTNVNCFNRYIQTILIPGITVFLFILFDTIKKIKKSNK